MKNKYYITILFLFIFCVGLSYAEEVVEDPCRESNIKIHSKTIQFLYEQCMNPPHVIVVQSSRVIEGKTYYDERVFFCAEVIQKRLPKKPGQEI